MKNSLQLFVAEKELIGKTIQWNAPAYKHNKPYSGVSKIVGVDRTNRKPLITETISGDNLSYAFIDEFNPEDLENEMMCYSDGERYITFEIL